jgi:hypothetical protein
MDLFPHHRQLVNRQVDDVKLPEHSEKGIAVIAVHDASRQGCFMTGFVVSDHFHPERK